MTLNVTVPDTVYRRLPSWLQLLQGIREVRSLERRELRTREISGLEGYYEIGPAFTASSRTKSSLGSGRSGRQRKKIGRRFALAHKKCTTVDIAAAQISACADPIECLLILENQGHGQIHAPPVIAHQPQQAVRRPTIGEQRGGDHVGVDHYLVHGPLPEYTGRAAVLREKAFRPIEQLRTVRERR